MKTRAAVLRQMGLPAPYSESRPLQIEELELAPPGPGELLVRVLAAGLCHSDLSVIDGSRPRLMPMVLGHEAAGEVLEVGVDTPGFGIGDRVVLTFVPACGNCPACATARPALCGPGGRANIAGTLLSGQRRWAFNHHLGVSAFSEYVVISARSAVIVESSLAPEIAALFGCAVLTGVGAVINTARVAPGQSVAVFGLGGVGLSALLGARASGAYPLVAVDLVESKLALARQLGATHAVNAGVGDSVAAVRELTGGGAEFCFETAGHELVLAEAYAATRVGGTTVTVGLPHPQKQLSISAVSLVVEERSLRGSYLGSAVPSRDIPRYIELYRAGLLPVDRLLSQTLRFDELNAGFDRLASGQAIRQVVNLFS